MTAAQREALGMLLEKPRFCAEQTGPERISGRVAANLARLGFAHRTAEGGYERLFKITDAGRRAYARAVELAHATASLPSVTECALVFLAEAGHHGLGASTLGARLWPSRTSKGCSNGGGGDYAAQMLLGRMRKAGLVRTQRTEGSSVWEVTPLGMAKADILRNRPAA
jgi:predicted transcriptional regulator